MFAHQCFVGAIWTHTFQKRGVCVNKVEYHWSRVYRKIYFCVIESTQNYRPANSEKNVDFDSFKSSECAATDTPARARILILVISRFARDYQGCELELELERTRSFCRTRTLTRKNIFLNSNSHKTVRVQ